LTTPGATAATGDRCDDPFLVGALPYIDVQNTATFLDDYRPIGQCSAGNPAYGQGPDAVYFYPAGHAPDSVTFYVSPRGHWDCVLYAYVQDCNGLCIAGANDRGPGEPEYFTLVVQPNFPIFIVVDGYAGSRGDYFFSINQEDDTRCFNIGSPLLGVAGVFTGGRPKGHWRAHTHAAAPHHQIVGPPPPCQRVYQVPWPRVGAEGAALWIAQANAEQGPNFLGIPIPSTATAILHLMGHYTVFPKSPWENQTVHCQAEWTVNGWQRVFPGVLGWGRSDVGVRILVDPFWNPPIFPGRTIARKTGDEDFAEAFTDSDVQLRDVPILVPQIVDLRFKVDSDAWGTGFASGWLSTFDLTIECPDDFPSGDSEKKQLEPAHRGTPLALAQDDGHEVQVRIRESRVERREAVQVGEISVPDGFTYSFIPVDSLGTPGGIDWSDGHGFGERLFLTRNAGATPLSFGEYSPPDSSVVMTYLDGDLTEFASDALRAPSDLLFDRTGTFGFKLLAAVADSFAAESGAPALGHGVLAAMDAGGALAVLASGLESPVALALPSSPEWDDDVYVAQVVSGRIDRIASNGGVSDFTCCLGMPTDLAFGSGSFGSYLYVAEADAAQPDTMIHAGIGTVTRFDPLGVESTFASGLHLPTALAWGEPDGPFGDRLFVALADSLDELGKPVPETGRIVQIDPSGEIAPFASGLEQPMRLAFEPGGDLYVAVGGGIIKISPLPSAGVPAGEDDAPSVPGAMELAVAPNPFTGSTRIQVGMPRSVRAALTVFDVSGRVVAVLADERFGPGQHPITWDGTDRKGRGLPSGIYFLRLEAEDGTTAAQRVIRVR
jgi:hypothetical protein